MTRKTTAIALLAAFAAIGLCAADTAPQLTYDPNHFQNDDPIWAEFDKAQVRADTARGEYHATFPAALRARQDKPLRIPGFILPLEPTSLSAHFMLVRRNTACPFCPPNAPTEAVEVFAVKPVRYTGEEISMSGRLKLVSDSAQGLFFQLVDAEPAPARP